MNYQRLYEYRFRDVNQSARVAVWREIAPFIHELLGRPARVLDPAAGRGEFINAVPAAERWAVDQVTHAEGTYEASVKTVVSDIFDVELPPQYFGGVLCRTSLSTCSRRSRWPRFWNGCALLRHPAAGSQ